MFGDDDEFPCIDADTASFAYARLQRMREEVATGYDEAALDALRQRARGAGRSDGRDGYIFMINGAKVRAPAAALALQQRLGIAPAERCAITPPMRTDQQPLRLTLFAPEGRMGRAIAEAVAADRELRDRPRPWRRAGRFFRARRASRRASTARVARGHPDPGRHDRARRSRRSSGSPTRRAIVAVLRAANTSLGVAVLADLVERAARVLGPDDWDIEIVEAHHNKKADAPSGTALHLGEAAEAGAAATPRRNAAADGTGLAARARRDRLCRGPRRHGRRRP